ncbi:MAG: hypothetical protein ACREV6_20530 [Clostridium sp.]|uniref:hypothetical protein n=1 Tax=Clostridium sp. TaxID=1506 RepID=UPI003D6DA1EE
MIKKFTCIKDLEQIRFISEIKTYIEDEGGQGDKVMSTVYRGYNENLELKCNCGNVYKATAYEYFLYDKRCGKCIANKFSNCVESLKSNNDIINENIAMPIRTVVIQVSREKFTQQSFIDGMEARGSQTILSDKLVDIVDGNSKTFNKQISPQQCFNQYKKSESKHEETVEACLNRKNIIYKRRKKINLGKKKYEFDFWILDDEGKIKFLIEVDGELHFRNCIGGEKRLLKCQLNDQIRNDFCESTNTRLIRIPYWEIRYIDRILDKELDFKYDKESELNKLWNAFGLNED